MNTTTYARNALGLRISAPAQPLQLENAVGIALRHNPRRAHLLVSSLLGKHTPQRPDIVDAAARILGTRAVDVLLGLSDRTEPALIALDYALMDESRPAPQAPTPEPADVVVVGFAEAASALGATVASHVNAYYVCSTRTPQRPAYGQFLEAHSHAAEHFLTPSDHAYLDDASRPVILVDDELTTGRTAMNTIRALHAHASHPAYVIATLADLRTEAARAELDAFATEIGVPVRVAALFSASIEVPLDAVERATEAIAEAATAGVLPSLLSTEHHRATFTFDRAVHARDGVPAGMGMSEPVSELEGLLYDDNDRGGRTLVLGVEEDMTLALVTATRMKASGMDVYFSSTTRSPAALIADGGYPLHDGVRFEGPDGNARFVYNISGRFEHIIVISADPLYAPTFPALARALDGHAAKVTIAVPRKLQEPLCGPDFGSYDADDVKWLLKDLSHAALEVSLEDREELVQAGSHYAESLPQEYQPSEEYMELFWDALSDNALRVADDIAVVAHRIMRARHNRPVLVSLARAGTPVGVLLRRYLRKYFDYEAPHYAVSIVRGRGIDPNALAYLATRESPENIIFVDGWTGKGAITAELRDALIAHELLTGDRFSPELAVLADTGDCTTLYGTREDYLIPSAALNSTVSGLVSRTVLNDTLIGKDDYHGAKFYAALAENDVSLRFIDEVASQFTALSPESIPASEPPTWRSWAEVERLSEKYGIGAVNLVKPGVGETTRVLLRRVPWRVLLNPDAGEAVAHIRALAEARGVPVEEVPGLRFNAVGLIHPHFTKSASGADGFAVAPVGAA